MKLGKLISLGVLAALGWQHQELVREQLETLLSIYPIAQTYVEMASFRRPLIYYLDDHDGEPPPDLPAWLDANFTVTAKERAGVDYFGTPYQIQFDERPTLVSCGPDKVCGTDDDLRMPL